MKARAKVQFKLEKDSDDYPPFAVESVWALPTADRNVFVVDNIPFFARQATLGDKVRVKRQEGALLFEKVVARSASSLLRVIVFDNDYVQEVRDELKKRGCSTEFFGARPIIAVDVPATVSLEDVRKYLDPLERNDVLTYEEPILRHTE